MWVMGRKKFCPCRDLTPTKFYRYGVPQPFYKLSELRYGKKNYNRTKKSQEKMFWA